jgi:hypothetical protein
MTVLYNNNKNYNTDGGAAVAEAAAEDDIDNNNITMKMMNEANNTFLQKNHVGNNRMFNSDQILTFELLMQSLTAEFITSNMCPELTMMMANANNNNDNGNGNGTTAIIAIIDGSNETAIRSNCTVINQYIDYDDDPPTATMNTTNTTNTTNTNTTTTTTTTESESTTTTTATATDTATNVSDTVIVLHYMVSYESSICDVINYPILFQKYTNSHLDIITEKLNTLNLNITQMERAARVVVPTLPK